MTPTSPPPALPHTPALLRTLLVAACGAASVLIAPSMSLAATTLYVSTVGDDGATGTHAEPQSTPGEGPLATVATAIERAREMRQQNPSETFEIVIAPGRYPLEAPLHLTPMDSGLTIRGDDRGATILSGGRRITGWTQDPSHPGMWTADLPEVRDGQWYFHQLFVDGQRATRARTPNEGFLRAAGALGEDSPISMPFHAGDLDPRWADYPDGRLVMLMKWTDMHLPIAEIDSEKHIAYLTGNKRASWANEPDARYWVENVPDALDQPGEWYLDRGTGQLRYLALEGIDPNQSLVIAPRLQAVVRIEGDASGNAVDSVKIQELTFAETDYAMPSEGLMSPQAAVPMRGCFRATHATNCRLEDCAFQNFGGYAIELGRGCQNWRVVGNDIRDIGAGGIRIGEPGDKNPSPHDACHSHQVTDNTLHRLGRVFAPGCGIIIFQSGSNRIAHNHIHDLFYTGISVGWNWGYQETPCRDNIIEFNLVENVGQKRLSDMGGIYTLGIQHGTIIRNNLFRDVHSYQYGGWGLYTDEGSTGIVMENNVAYRCTDAGFHQHYGRDNLIRNNLLAWNENHSVMRTRVEDHLSFRFTHNVVVADSGTLLGSNWEGGTDQFLCDSNLWFDTQHGTDVSQYSFAGQSWDHWRERGQDVHSVIADPLLVDPERPELGLREGSPAFALGFQPIDLRGVGPRPPDQRNATP